MRAAKDPEVAIVFLPIRRFAIHPSVSIQSPNFYPWGLPLETGKKLGRVETSVIVTGNAPARGAGYCHIWAI